MPSGKPPVFIGVAWPYANGPLHLGHVAGSLLPPDIFRRAMRLRGHDVLMVSGSDCHGTPILLKAEKEGKAPAEVVMHYNAEHRQALDRLRIGFDLFTATTTDNHRHWVQDVFLAARRRGYIEVRTQKAPYDPTARRFLPDRYVEGTCPHCNTAGARGDQCDACGKTLDPQELKDPHSKLNPATRIEFRDTDHFFFLLSKLQPALEQYVAATSAHWRPSVVNFTNNWLKEGLQDRAITRDLTWGVPIPLPGYDDKRIYVWFEAVSGYFSAAVEWAQGQGGSDAARAAAWHKFWTNPACRSYYFLGKDNIPFHTIIWPAIILAYNEDRVARGEKPLNLPHDVPANEFLNLSGLKFSKSQGVGIGVQEILDRFQSDAVRYYLSINMPEGRDADWAWDDFRSKVNDELVGTLGNLIHRTLSFVHKNLGRIPDGPPEPAPLQTPLAPPVPLAVPDLAAAARVASQTAVPVADASFEGRVRAEILACGNDMGMLLDTVQLRKAARRLLEFAGQGNRFFDEAAPWRLLKEDRARGEAALHAMLRFVKALALYMEPFLPDAAEATWKMLNESGTVHDARWEDALAPLRSGTPLAPPVALFRKLEPADVPGIAPVATSETGGRASVARPAGVARPSGDSVASHATVNAKANAASTTHVPPAEAAARASDVRAVAPVAATAAAGGVTTVAAGAVAPGRSGQSPPGDAQVSIEEFGRVQLRLARVVSVEPHPKADKLLVIKLDAGDLGTRQVVAGLKKHYPDPKELVGQTVAFVANLKPAMLRGVESQGMILAADDGTNVAVLNPQKPLPAGSRIR